MTLTLEEIRTTSPDAAPVFPPSPPGKETVVDTGDPHNAACGLCGTTKHKTACLGLLMCPVCDQP